MTITVHIPTDLETRVIEGLCWAHGYRATHPITGEVNEETREAFAIRMILTTPRVALVDYERHLRSIGEENDADNAVELSHTITSTQA